MAGARQGASRLRQGRRGARQSADGSHDSARRYTFEQRNVFETTRPLWKDGRTAPNCIEGLRDSALLMRVCKTLLCTAV